jgi:hypothetical protein
MRHDGAGGCGENDLHDARTEQQAPETQELAKRQLESDDEEQQDDAELGEAADARVVGDQKPTTVGMRRRWKMRTIGRAAARTTTRSRRIWTSACTSQALSRPD